MIVLSVYNFSCIHGNLTELNNQTRDFRFLEFKLTVLNTILNIKKFYIKKFLNLFLVVV